MSIIEADSSSLQMFSLVQKKLTNLKGSIKYSAWDTANLMMVELTNDVITILELSIEKQRSFIKKCNYTEWKSKNVISAFFVEDQAFIIAVDHQILQMYFLHDLQEQIIKLTLEEDIKIKDNYATAYLQYPDLFIYCKNEQKGKNNIISMNMMTLMTKRVCEGKGYVPENCNNFVSLFVQKRLYVFGGQNQLGEKCDELFWTFDFEKNYWFALEMKYDQNEEFSECRILYVKNGRVLLISRQNQVWLLQLYQGKVYKMNLQVKLQQKCTYFVFNQLLFSYSQSQRKLNCSKIQLKKKVK